MATVLKDIGCCVHVLDIGTQMHSTERKTRIRREMILGWELLNPENSSASKPVIVYKTYVMSMAPDASLRKDAERLLGYEINAETHKRFGVKALLGRFCQVIVRRNSTEVSGSAICVIRIKSLTSDLVQATLPNAKTPYGLFMTSEPDMELLSSLPPEIQAKIKQSIEFTWAIKKQNDYDLDE